MSSIASYCPCGIQKTYPQCCGLIHTDIKNAKTAEQLMRSRYTAFTLANGDYLMESHHPSKRKIKEKHEIVQWAQSVTWLRLEVLHATKGSEHDTEGTVEFKAFFKEGATVRSIEENSRFVKEEGTWFYYGVN